jgi:hypothetical protein
MDQEEVDYEVGSGNVFKDLGLDDFELELKKARHDFNQKRLVNFLLAVFVLMTTSLFYVVYRSDRSNAYQAKIDNELNIEYDEGTEADARKE